MMNPAAPLLDIRRRFVRVRREREDGFVEFDFAVGDPELSVGLILRRADFESFCRQPGIERMSAADAQWSDARLAAYERGEPLPQAGFPSQPHPDNTGDHNR